MNPTRIGDLGDFFWRAFATALIAVVLHAPDSSAFQQRGASGLRGVLSALIAPPAAGRDSPDRPENDGELAFQLVDFDLGKREPDLCIGAGWFATLTPAFEYFTAVGLNLPDPDAPSLAEEGEDNALCPLTVGPWAGTGVGWRPAQGLRLSLEARWNPAEIGLLGGSAARCPFQAGLSLAMNW